MCMYMSYCIIDLHERERGGVLDCEYPVTCVKSTIIVCSIYTTLLLNKVTTVCHHAQVKHNFFSLSQNYLYVHNIITCTLCVVSRVEAANSPLSNLVMLSHLVYQSMLRTKRRKKSLLTPSQKKQKKKHPFKSKSQIMY